MRSGGRRGIRGLHRQRRESMTVQGGGKGRIRGCTLQWRQTDKDCNNQLTMMGVHPQQLQAQEGRLRSCPHRRNGGDVINCQLSDVVTIKLHWQRLGGERGRKRHEKKPRAWLFGR